MSNVLQFCVFHILQNHQIKTRKQRETKKAHSQRAKKKLAAAKIEMI